MKAVGFRNGADVVGEGKGDAGAVKRHDEAAMMPLECLRRLRARRQGPPELAGRPVS